MSNNESELLKELDKIADDASNSYTNSEEGYNTAVAKEIYEALSTLYADKFLYARYDLLVPTSTLDMLNQVPSLDGEDERLDEHADFSVERKNTKVNIPDSLKQDNPKGHIVALANVPLAKGDDPSKVLSYADDTLLFSAYSASKALGLALYLKVADSGIFMLGVRGALTLMSIRKDRIRTAYLTPETAENPKEYIENNDIFSEHEKGVMLDFAKLAVCIPYMVEAYPDKLQYWADGCTLRTFISLGDMDKDKNNDE